MIQCRQSISRNGNMIPSINQSQVGHDNSQMNSSSWLKFVADLYPPGLTNRYSRMHLLFVISDIITLCIMYHFLTMKSNNLYSFSQNNSLANKESGRSRRVNAKKGSCLA